MHAFINTFFKKNKINNRRYDFFLLCFVYLKSVQVQITKHIFCLDIHGEVLVVLLDYLLLYGFTLCTAILAQEWL